MNGRERGIFLVAPIELLKNCVVVFLDDLLLT